RRAMRNERVIGSYFGLLAFVGGLADPNGGLVQLPLLFVLKDQLHLDAQWVAWFGAITAVPGHAGVLFGAGRDRWRPRRLGDRGSLLAASVIVVACYVWLATTLLTVTRLLAAATFIAVAFQAFDTSSRALLTIVGQRRLMTGRLSALVEIADGAVSV